MTPADRAPLAGLQRNPQPHHLPFAVVGTTVATRVAEELGSAVEVTPAADDSAARHAVKHHDTVAGLSFLNPTTVNLYLAGPNGLAENAAAEAIADDISPSREAKLRIIDLVPTGRNDPRALNSFYLALSATVASFILAQAMFAVRQITRLRAQLLTLAGFAVVIGAALAITSVRVLDLTPAETVPLALVLAAISVSVSLSSRALAGRFGSYGITASTLAMTAVWSAHQRRDLRPAAAPVAARRPGCRITAGPGSAAHRVAEHFHGAGALGPLLGLAAWAAAGLGSLVLHRTTRPRQSARPRRRHPSAHAERGPPRPSTPEGTGRSRSACTRSAPPRRAGAPSASSPSPTSTANREPWPASRTSPTARARDALTIHATMDPLTGCHNRASVLAALEHALATTPAGSTAVVFIDLDHFEPVNDELGYAVGDELLVHVAAVLATISRPHDLVGRIGGDEFLLVLTDITGALRPPFRSPNARRALHQPVSRCGHIVNLGASIGVACSRPVDAAKSLTARADVAMYASKSERAGRPHLESEDDVPVDGADRPVR